MAHVLNMPYHNTITIIIMSTVTVGTVYRHIYISLVKVRAIKRVNV
jgi:hypothetical protein